jgi:hypothetical protein
MNNFSLDVLGRIFSISWTVEQARQMLNIAPHDDGIKYLNRTFNRNLPTFGTTRKKGETYKNARERLDKIFTKFGKEHPNELIMAHLHVHQLEMARNFKESYTTAVPECLKALSKLSLDTP